jgi:predicted ATPase
MQLFMERAAESGVRLEVSDAEAPIVASICRKLDGVALAIELAARRVESYGLQAVCTLGKRFRRTGIMRPCFRILGVLPTREYP